MSTFTFDVDDHKAFARPSKGYVAFKGRIYSAKLSASPFIEEVQDAINTGIPYVPAPRSVTPRQMRLWLLSKGIDVKPLFAAMPEPEKTAAEITFEYATEFRRDDHLLLRLASALNLTSKDIDNAFIEASKL